MSILNNLIGKKVEVNLIDWSDDIECTLKEVGEDFIKVEIQDYDGDEDPYIEYMGTRHIIRIREISEDEE